MQHREQSIARATAIIVAAGRGERFGAPDKVFLPLAGRPIIAHILDTTEQSASVSDVILVVGDHTRASAEDLVAEGPWEKVQAIVTGGSRRQDSVAAGLAEISPDCEIVAIHDGARPLAPVTLFDACIAAAFSTGAAIAASPVSDTLKRASGGRIVETIPREHMWAAQTPQAFRVELLRRAIDTATHEKINATDEAFILEHMGVPVAIVPSTAANIKITQQDDLWIAEALFAHRSGNMPEVDS